MMPLKHNSHDKTLVCIGVRGFWHQCLRVLQSATSDTGVGVQCVPNQCVKAQGISIQRIRICIRGKCCTGHARRRASKNSLYASKVSRGRSRYAMLLRAPALVPRTLLAWNESFELIRYIDDFIVCQCEAIQAIFKPRLRVPATSVLLHLNP